MKQKVLTKLRIASITLAVFFSLLLTGTFILNTDKVQNWLAQYTVDQLKTQLATEVRLEHASISLLRQQVNLEGLEIDDRQGRKMLQMKQMGVGLNLWELLRHNVVVNDARVVGLQARLRKPASATDSASNYQFIVEAMKSHRHQGTTPASESPRRPISFHVKRAVIDIDSLCYTTDNGRPRRNTGKPHRGAFDAGHLNLRAAATISIDYHIGKGLQATLTNGRLTDPDSGLDIRNFDLQANLNHDSLQLTDIRIALPHTTLSIPQATIHIPDPKSGHILRYKAPTVTGMTELRDIARPFAPTLKNFKQPLQLSCAVNGDADGMRFTNVLVNTPDHRLDIQGHGNISQLRDKHHLRVHFGVKKLRTTGKTAIQIINQFAVKKFMMSQLNRLGNIRYRGDFDVLWHRERFSGRLNTDVGTVDFNFTIDNENKHLFGEAGTEALQIGQLMDLPDLGETACSAKFHFDISKQRTAEMRRRLGGHLPIGSIDADVKHAAWKFISVNNVKVVIQSDGAKAIGDLDNRGNFLDLGCSFTFTNTNDMKDMTVKPRVKLHW